MALLLHFVILSIRRTSFAIPIRFQMRTTMLVMFGSFARTERWVIMFLIGIRRLIGHFLPGDSAALPMMIYSTLYSVFKYCVNGQI